jgi:hypothetical protein
MMAKDRVMAKDRFVEAMFELVDLWTVKSEIFVGITSRFDFTLLFDWCLKMKVSAADYASFLRKLRAVSMPASL